MPTGQQLTDAVQMFLKGMELEEHQTFVAVHANTHLACAFEAQGDIWGGQRLGKAEIEKFNNEKRNLLIIT